MYKELRFAKKAHHQFLFLKTIPEKEEIKGALQVSQVENSFKIDGFYFDTYMISPQIER